MNHCRNSPVALAELEEIRDFIAVSNPPTADRLMDQFLAEIRLLAEFPGDDLPGSMRSRRVKSYLIFYQQVSDGIEILHVIHGKRDLPELFR